MIPEYFQDELIEELKRILGDRTYRSQGGEPVPIKFFAQSLPVLQNDDEDEPIPYVVVRIQGGEDTGGPDSSYVIKVAVIVGVFDDDGSAQGHREILNIINPVYRRFHAEPLLNNKYRYRGHFKWILQEDDYHPFYFGAMEMEFEIPAIRKEDYLA